MQIVASIPHLTSLTFKSGQVTADGVRGLGQGITRLMFEGIGLDRAAAGELASLTQLSSLQLLRFEEEQDKPSLEVISSVPLQVTSTNSANSADDEVSLKK